MTIEEEIRAVSRLVYALVGVGVAPARLAPARIVERLTLNDSSTSRAGAPCRGHPRAYTAQTYTTWENALSWPLPTSATRVRAWKEELGPGSYNAMRGHGGRAAHTGRRAAGVSTVGGQ